MSRPNRCSMAAASSSGERRVSGSGARKSASSPGATTVGDFGNSAATRAASLLAAMPTRAGREMASQARRAARARRISGSAESGVGAGGRSESSRSTPHAPLPTPSSAKCRSIPVTSRKTTPSPASSTRGENVSATSSSASCAVRSHSASRPRAMSFGRSERACASEGRAGFLSSAPAAWPRRCARCCRSLRRCRPPR